MKDHINCSSTNQSGRNITCDNLLRASEVRSLQQNHTQSLIGIICKNKKELPKKFTDVKSRISAYFYHRNTYTLVSYVKKGKWFILSVHIMHEKIEKTIQQKEAFIL